MGRFFGYVFIVLNLMYVSYKIGQHNAPKPPPKPPLTAEEKAEGYRIVFTFYTIGCNESMDEIKLRIGATGDSRAYCEAKTADYRKRWEEANP